MKRILTVLAIVALLLTFLNMSVFAQQDLSVATFAAESEAGFLRAGGGGGGGGGGSGGGGGGSSGTHASGGYGTGYRTVLDDIIFGILFIFSLFGTAIIFRFKLSKYAINTKRLLNLLQTQDSAWKYKDIQKQVRETYFIVQKSWTALDMKPAQDYMSDALYEKFCTKLDWMKYREERNVLKRIKLYEAVPVSVYDDNDDSRDYVWFYISGSMVDYMIDTTTNLKISGTTVPEVFGEYWQFVRKNNGRWVLNKILQKDESDQIIFTE
ncbi:MAG: Tim44 domain-containing protein [Clostridia bacterium]|nr:Tim44 domain-containing protein [Clostridia bacterium]